MHGLVITLKGIGPLIGTFSLLIRDFRLKAMQPLEANSPISSPKSMNSKSEDQFLLELILCLTTVLTEDVQQLQSCCDHLNVHDCCRTLQMAMLNKTNAILRKRARHAALTLNWIDATCWQLLEALEESQVHLCKPVLDRLLIEWAPTQTAELTLSKLELVLQRMFDHTNKAIKRYALNYLSQLFTDPLHFESKISASFVFGHVFAALQDNQVYGDGLAERSLCFVNRYNVNDVLNSLLLMQSSLSPFSLFYVTRDLNTFDKIDQTPFSLEPFRVQQLMQSIQRVCAEPIVRAAIQLQLLKAVIERAGLRSPCTSEMNSLTTLVGCLNLKEVKVAVFRDFFKHWPKLFVEMTLLQQSDTEMKSAVCDLQIAGIARLLGAHFCANLTAITRIINQEFTKLTLNAKQIFIQNLLLTLHLDHIEALDKLLGLVMQPEFLHLLQPLSDHIPDEFVLFRRKSKSAIFDAVEPHPFPRLYTFLESQFNGDPFLVFDLITKLCFSPDVFESHSKQINQDLIDLNLRFELTRDLCWTWLIEHLDYPIIWKQCKPIFSNILGAQDDKDNTIDLIQIVPTHLNSYVIQVYGKLLRNEIACLVRNPTTRASLSILNNFEAIFSQLFKSCLELRKKEFYRQTFYALISEFAFAPYLLCLTADQLKSIGIEDGAKDYRLNRFAKVESAEVQAFLIDHVSRVMSYDFKRFHLNKPDYSAHEELLFQITVDGILFERKQLNLMQMLIERVSNDVNIFEHILCTESPHFHRNVRCQAIVASFSGMQLKVTKFQNRLVQRLIQREINLLSEDGVKSFPHSRIHRQQTKIWQYFTLLSFHLIQQSQSFWEPVVSDSDKQTLQLVYEHTIRSILDQTAAQLSVRHLQSVLLICLLESPLIGPHFVAQFRCTLEDLLENRSTGVGCFQTLLCVLYHLIPSQPTFDFFPIGCLLSCHHYRVRLFSHLVMQRLEDRLMITFNDHGTRTFHTAPKAAANFTKNLQQLRNDWFFAHLNVSRDLCCLLILEHLPRLTDCLHDDLLFAEQFCGRSYDFRIELSNERLIEANPSRLFDRNFDQPNSTIDQSEQCALVDIFQRKCMIPVFNQSSITTSTQRICGNLIICASLIGKRKIHFECN